MARHALFEGLIVDEFDQPVESKMVGDEAFYVVNDDGFLRHISSEEVDRQVLAFMAKTLEGHEDVISEQAAKMLGQEDIFTRAMIERQLENIDEQFEKVLETGPPQGSRAFLGMSGFRVRVDLRGQVLEVQQPGAISPEDE